MIYPTNRDLNLLRNLNAALRGDMTIPKVTQARHPAATNGPLVYNDAARSVGNIKMWSSYLPPDCIEAMRRMRWDVTT